MKISENKVINIRDQSRGIEFLDEHKGYGEDVLNHLEVKKKY